MCVEKYKNDVYEQNIIKPNVINPDCCIDGYRGCLNLCSAEIISYVGDNGEQKLLTVVPPVISKCVCIYCINIVGKKGILYGCYIKSFIGRLASFG